MYICIINLSYFVPGSDNVVSGTISNSTEFSVLPSRKTSYASTFWSNPYEDTLLQTKDISDEKDKWEFPRHHLKFYGILGISMFLLHLVQIHSDNIM